MLKNIKRHILQGVLLGISLILFTGCDAATPTPTPQASVTIPLSSCQLSAPELSISVSARCGKLAVPENRDSPTSRMIDLNIAVVPAASAEPAPDPLFFLAGGPGQAATESYPQISFAFNEIHKNRDIVLVDQRGTGKSNPLICPSPGPGSENSTNATDLTSWAEDCLKQLDGDPRYYTTSIAVQDLDQVREALGYERINLYGVSYGTRVAQTYLRQFSDRVRATILDGVVPQNEDLGLNVARNAQHAIDLIFQRCAENSACQSSFPELNSEFTNLVESLKNNSVKTNVVHPVSGEIQNIEFTRDALANTIRLLSYTSETAALLPLQIHTAQTSTDFSLLAAQYLIVADQVDQGIANGLNYSVLCSEDIPFYTPEQADQANQGTYMGNLQTNQLFEICKVWPRGEIPPDFKQPVHSNAPVLMLSGEDDPVTPPSNAEMAAKTLTNSLSLIAPGQGHNVIYRGCLPLIASNFMDTATVQGLQTGCLQGLEPMPFFVNFSGPVPQSP
jgi:pimeloyl-ACP methyl ester carboxylesterase